MHESYGEGPASHPDPESCADGRKAGGEALTRAHVGQPSNCEIRQSGVPTLLSEAEELASVGATLSQTSDAQPTPVGHTNVTYIYASRKSERG